MSIDRAAVERVVLNPAEVQQWNLADLCRSWLEQADLILSQQRKIESRDSALSERFVEQQLTIEELRKALKAVMNCDTQSRELVYESQDRKPQKLARH